MSGQERDRLLLRCKQYNKKVSQGIPALLNKLHLAGSGRRDTCPITAGTLTVVYAPWTAVNTQNKRFCKTKGLNLDSVMNVNFKWQKKTRKSKRKTWQACNEIRKT